MLKLPTFLVVRIVPRPTGGAGADLFAAMANAVGLALSVDADFLCRLVPRLGHRVQGLLRVLATDRRDYLARHIVHVLERALLQALRRGDA